MVCCKTKLERDLSKIKIKIKLTKEFERFLCLLGRQCLADNARSIVRNSSH